jgi:hypothetical protein
MVPSPRERDFMFASLPKLVLKSQDQISQAGIAGIALVTDPEESRMYANLDNIGGSYPRGESCMKIS